MTDNLLEIDDLTVGLPTDEGLLPAVRGLTLRVRRGEAFGIVGESGSGKSVAALAVMGLLPRGARVGGSVRLLGEEVLTRTEKELESIRGRRVSMIFQDPLTSLNPVHPVGDQIAEAVLAHQRVPARAARDRAVDLLRVVGIPDPAARARSYPHELSGGMRQRVVIAIAMANDPELIIADEPTTALDVTVQAQVLEALATARRETGAALILITHDLGVVAGHTDRVGVMYAGRLVETGTVDDIFYTPRMPYTLGLLGSQPRLDDAGRQRLTPIAGSPPSPLALPPGCPFSPRCPLVRDVCRTSTPELTPTTGPAHLAACHFHASVAGSSASEVFS